MQYFELMLCITGEILLRSEFALASTVELIN